LARAVASIEKAGTDSDVIVFPEYSMGFPEKGLSRKYLGEVAEPLTGDFVSVIAEASKRQHVTVVIPIFEKDKDTVYNTAVAISRGTVLGGYRKIHLFDALGYRESDLFRAGSSPVTFKVGETKFGLVICYDVRFPELIRAEVMGGAQAVIAPAAWYAGPLKEEQWQSLLMARAHENTSYLIGVGNANPAFIGRSIVVDPFGVKTMDLGSGDRIGFCHVEEGRISKAREALPLLKQAASTVYGPCLQL
jgi:predicted amidohydrolase